jgi:hypothetical protein
MNFRSAPARPRLARSARRGLAACSLAIGLAATAPAVASADLGAWKFQTAPTVQPMKVQVLTSNPGMAPGDIFTAPFHNFAVSTPLTGQPGTLILDSKGNPIWFRSVPAGQEALDFKTQTLNGKPVLTWWQGPLNLPPKSPAGVPVIGQGAFFVYDQHYKLITKIRGQNGWTADPHELLLTPQGTAIFPAVKEVTADLTKFHGSATGRFEDNAIQEVDLKTGKLVFSWDMGAHVPLSQAQVAVPPLGVWDPYHINSIDEDTTGGHLLVSARNTWGVYEISHKSGDVIWQVGGTGETIKPGANADFSWQHDAKFLPNNQISLFDDSCCNVPFGKPTRFARGLVLKIDSTAKTAAYVTSYTHNPGLDVSTQGNMQTLPNGNVFVGWGQQPVFSEYSAKGKLLYDVSMPSANESYRTVRQAWVGKPRNRPSVIVHRVGRRVTLYVSWNGATDVTRWKVLGGPSKSKLKTIKTAGRRGFETTIRFKSTRLKFEVKALSAKRKVLGTSALVKPTKPPATGG